MKKPKKSDYKFYCGLCTSFRKEAYETAVREYEEFLKTKKDVEI